MADRSSDAPSPCWALALLLVPSLIITTSLSLWAMLAVVQMLFEFGAVMPLRVRLASSQWWVPACFAVASGGVVAASLSKRSGYLAAALLTVSTLLLLAAAAITVSSLFHSMPLAGDFGLPARR